MTGKLNRFLSLIMVLAILLSAFAIIPATAEKADGQNSGASTASGATYYDTVAQWGEISLKYGDRAADGRTKLGSVLTIKLTQGAVPAGLTFKYWKSAYGDVIPNAQFELYVDRDAYFYPVFEQTLSGFGPWELLKVRNCEDGDIYVRTHLETGLKQYKLKYYNFRCHDFTYSYVNEDDCRAVCSHCGYSEVNTHDWSGQTVVKEATADEDGLAEYTCNRCKAKKQEIIPALGELEHEHSWSSYGAEILQEAKDGQPGIRRVHCTTCAATKDVWYIRAEWEKYYFGNRLYYDTADSSTYRGTNDELHYSFVNDEGYDTYVYAVREDYRDDDQSWMFMWIDHADELGRKPLYLAKGKGKDETFEYPAYSWAVIDYSIRTRDQYIEMIDSLRVGDDRHSSGFFDNVKRYETLYNEQMFPADGSSDFLENMSQYWVYENDNSELIRDSNTGIYVNTLMYVDGREYLHIDPDTCCVIWRYEPSSFRMESYIKGIKPIVRPDEYTEIIDSFPAVEVSEAPEPFEGNTVADHTEHNYPSSYNSVYVNEKYHKNACTECGHEEYYEHSLNYTGTPDLNFDDIKHSTAIHKCYYCGYEEAKPYLMSTDEISDDIYRVFSDKSSRGLSVWADVKTTPNPKNFQLRVDPTYLVGGPDDNTYDSDYGDRTLYYSNGYAAMEYYTYAGNRSDFLGYGVIRAAEDNFAWVDLKATEVDNYVFKRWEIYDWETGEWKFFSDNETAQFNNIVYTYDDDWNVTSVENSLVHDLTILRAVREYVEPEKYTIKVEGGSYYLANDSQQVHYTEGTVDQGEKIWLEFNGEDVPENMEFDHFDVCQNGEPIDVAYTYQTYSVNQDNLVFKPVYQASRYRFEARAENGYIISESADGGKDGKTDDDGTSTVVGDTDKDKIAEDEKEKDKEDKQTDFYGEYEAGTVITLTTEAMSEDYPYFLGWYFVTISEMGEERDLITTATTLEATVTAGGDDKDSYTYYLAVWSDTAEVDDESDTNYHIVTGDKTFVGTTGMVDGVKVSVLRVSDYNNLNVVADPTYNFIPGEFYLSDADDPTAEKITAKASGFSGDFCIDSDSPANLVASMDYSEEEKVVTGYTVSLDSEISVNYYLNIPADVDMDDTEADFTWGDDDYQGEADVELIKLDEELNGANYIVSCNVAARAMTDVLHLTLSVNGSPILVNDYSVVSYAAKAAEVYKDDPATRKVLCDMLDYGAAAQRYFEYKTDNLASDYIEEIDSTWTRQDAVDEMTDPTNLTALDADKYGLQFAGASMFTTSKTKIRLYFDETSDNAASTVITVNGTEQELKHNRALNKWYIEIAGLAARDIFDGYTVTFVNGENSDSLTYSAANYYNAIVNGEYPDALKNVMQRMSVYSDSAKAVFPI